MAGAEASALDVEDLTVLVIGEGEPLAEGVREALQRRGFTTMTAPLLGSTQAAIAMAPDLVLLVGDAAANGGHEVLGRLSGAPLAAVLPVAILTDDQELDDRLRAFRFGAAAVVPRSASVDAIANRVAELTHEIPERSSRTSGELGGTTLDDFVRLLSRELRAGILSVETEGGVGEDAIRIVLGEGRSVAGVVEEFVSRVRPLIQQAEVVRYEFHEQPGGTVQLLGADGGPDEGPAGDIRQMRILLADQDVARADAVAQELRARGASVVMTDLAGSRIARVRDLDPSVLVVGESELRGEGYQLIRRMREDLRLRWTFLLVVNWEEVWSASAPGPVVERLVQRLHTLSETERSLREKAVEGAAFDTRLEAVGPARLLRALAHGKGTFRAMLQTRRALFRIDFSEGLVAGAVAQLPDEDRRVYGPAALAALLSVSSGKVRVEPVSSPAAANVMSTVDGALSTAEAEESPLRPSTLVKAPPPRSAPADMVAWTRLTPAQPMNRPRVTNHGVGAPVPRSVEPTKPHIPAPAVMPPTPRVPVAAAPRPATSKTVPKAAPKAAPKGAPQPAPRHSSVPPPPASSWPSSSQRGDPTPTGSVPPPAPKADQTPQPVPGRRVRKRHPTLVGMPAPSSGKGAQGGAGRAAIPAKPAKPATPSPAKPPAPAPAPAPIEPPTDTAAFSSPAGDDAFAPPLDDSPFSADYFDAETVVEVAPALEAPEPATDPPPPPRSAPPPAPSVPPPAPSVPSASAPPPPPAAAMGATEQPAAWSPLGEAAAPAAQAHGAAVHGIAAPPAPQSQPTVPLTAEDIAYPDGPVVPNLLAMRKEKASRLATLLLAAGLGVGLLVGLIVVGVILTSGGDGEDELAQAGGEPSNTAAPGDDDSPTPDGEGSESGSESGSGASGAAADDGTDRAGAAGAADEDDEDDGADAAGAAEDEDPRADRDGDRPAAGAALPGAIPDATVDLPRQSRRVQRMSEARREASARRLRIRGARALRQGAWPRALRFYRESLLYEPTSGEAHRGYAIALYRRRRYEDAVAWMRRAIELEPGHPDWYVLLGDGYREMGDRRSARAVWRHALELDPNNGVARLRLR